MRHLLGGIFLRLLIHLVKVLHRIFELGRGLVEVALGDFLAGFADGALGIVRRLKGLHQGVLGFGVLLGLVPFLGGLVVHFLEGLEGAAVGAGGLIQLGCLVELVQLGDELAKLVGVLAGLGHGIDGGDGAGDGFLGGLLGGFDVRFFGRNVPLAKEIHRRHEIGEA